MLTSTFCCFRGLGTAAEGMLWRRGCLTWHMFTHLQRPLLSAPKTGSIRNQIVEAEAALAAGLIDYFLNRLPPAHRVRVLPHVSQAIAYIDIETTGLDETDTVTTVALTDGLSVKTFVAGKNMHELLHELARAQLLVTFNGIRFDLPFLRRRFNIDLKTPHLDLMPALRALGFRGGLKQIEKQVGIRRDGSEDGDGKQAIELWKQYAAGDQAALTNLLRYNARDALSLVTLAAMAYNHSMAHCPITTRREPPTQPDIRRILDQLAL